MLAGVSVDYYTRLERGNSPESPRACWNLSPGPSSSTTPNANTSTTWPGRPTPAPAQGPSGAARPRPCAPASSTCWTRWVPAYVRNGRLDILGANHLARAVFAPIFQEPTGRPNLARFVFLDPASPDFYRDWEQLAEDIVALLRSEAGRNPYDRDLTDLIGELSTRSDRFRTWWAAHDVRLHRPGAKRLHHPMVGDLTLAYESMDLTTDQGLRLNAYSAEPGSPDQDALNLIASWAATTNQPETSRHD
jgi:MmyB-like transcription regulator ligand binding domain